MADLKSCPFCGGEAREFETEHDSEYQYQVQCRGCGAEIAFWSPWTAGAGQRATAALDCVERWNRRALPAASQPEAAPVVWVIPGNDTEDCNGFVDAMGYEYGEFTRPLYARPTPAPVVPAEDLSNRRAYQVGYAAGQAAALRSAPPVGARVTGWQPIETAPKDGVTEVLMYDPVLGMAVWPSANSPWPNVTHWMPLPEPPAALLPAGEGE